MMFASKLQNWDNFDLFGDILESQDLIIFAQKRLKTAVGSALNNNNNNKSQRQQ